jgi:hypothetical protein
LNKKQRENLARYAYDLSKIMVAVPILGNSLATSFSVRAFWFGLAAAGSFLLFGLLLDHKQESDYVES